MGKTIDTLINVAGAGLGVGLIAWGLHEAFVPDDTGMNLVQKFGATYGTPEVAQYAKAAVIAKMKTAIGSLGVLYILERNNM